MRNLKLESIEVIKELVGNYEVVEIEAEECDELVRVDDSGHYSEDERISIERLLEEGQDDYDCNHFYAYDMEEDEVIGYFKVNY